MSIFFNRVDKNEDGRITEEEVKEVNLLAILTPLIWILSFCVQL